MSEPAVEMLWEAADPDVVLRERFGFTSGGEAEAWLQGVFSGHYDMSLLSCERIVMSDGNALAWITASEGHFIVKWSVSPEKFDRLAAISALMVWLDERGHPVSAPVLSRLGEGQLVVDGVCLNVQRVMPGGHLDVADAGQVHAAGAALARLHGDLAAYPGASSPFGVSGPSSSMQDFLSSWLASDHSPLPHEPRAALRARVAEAVAITDETQLVHGDFRAANILTRDGQVTALLDFEEMRFDHPVSELARSAVMLGTLFHDWGPVTPGVHAAFLEGYESVRALNEQEMSWWPPLLLWWSLLMVPAEDDPTGWGHASRRLARALSQAAE